MVPMPMSGIYHMATILELYCSLLSMTQRRKLCQTTGRSVGLTLEKWQYVQLLMSKVALTVAHIDTHAAWLMQTHWTRGGPMVKRRQHCFLRES